MQEEFRTLLPWLEPVQSLLLARQAGLLHAYAGTGYRVSGKLGGDIVTDVDVSLQAALAQVLERFGLVVFGEESEGDWPPPERRERLVLVDPLDGTENFSAGVPCFGTMLVAFQGGQPWASMAWIPFESLLTRDGFYVAVRGRGAWRLHEDGAAARLAVSATTALGSASLAIEGPGRVLGASPLPARLARHCRTRRLGFSSSWCGTRLASGASRGVALDALLSVECAPWDSLPIALLVQEAGGRVTDLQGRPFSADNHATLLMSNGLLHDEMLQRLQGD